MPASSVAISSTSFCLIGCKLAGDRSFQLLRGHFGLVQSLRLDKIADRFRLGEIDSPVEKSAHRELARLRQARAPNQSKFDNVAQDYGRAVGRDLDDVVGGV